jgi:hypothetical protein
MLPRRRNVVLDETLLGLGCEGVERRTRADLADV